MKLEKLKAGNLSDLIKRIIVGAVGIPIAVGIIYLGGYLFMAVIIVISSLAMHEYYKLAEKKGVWPLKWLSIVFGALFLFVAFEILKKGGDYQSLHPGIVFPSLMILYILALLTGGLFRRKQANPLLSIAVSITGFMYITLSFMFLLGVRYFDTSVELAAGTGINSIKPWAAAIDGRWAGWLLLSVFLAVWICDSAAYFIGKAIGKHKLMERVSPKKTWEGAIAGFVFAIITFIVCTFFLIKGLPLIHAVVCGAIVGTAGQVGDLAESLLKRDAGVKDSSNLLPGHGGALDRFDSIIFVMPLVYIYLLAAAVVF